MSRLTKDQIYELVKEHGPLSTIEIRDFVYADDTRYRNQDDFVKRSYCYNCLAKLRKDGLVEPRIVWKNGTRLAIWEVCQ